MASGPASGAASSRRWTSSSTTVARQVQVGGDGQTQWLGPVRLYCRCRGLVALHCDWPDKHGVRMILTSLSHHFPHLRLLLVICLSAALLSRCRTAHSWKWWTTRRRSMPARPHSTRGRRRSWTRGRAGWQNGFGWTTICRVATPSPSRDNSIRKSKKN